MTPEKPFEFQVGDRVSWCGVEGVVSQSYGNGVEVTFSGNGCPVVADFFKDGRYRIFHTEPSLKLLERPKKKVKKRETRWVNIYREGVGIVLFLSEKLARKEAQGDIIACVEVPIEWEQDAE
jgi:hypothetical protein